MLSRITIDRRLRALVAVSICCLPVFAIGQDSNQAKDSDSQTPAQAKQEGHLSKEKQEAVVAVLDSKKERAKELEQKAADITKKIGELASSGNMPSSEAAINLMRELVNEMAGLRDEMKQMNAEIEGIKAWMEGEKESRPKLEKAVKDVARNKPSTYIQFQYDSSDKEESKANKEDTGGFRARRIRVGTKQKIDDKTTIKLSFDLATGTNQTSVALKDAFVTHKLQPETAVIVGHQPIPLGYEIARSSSRREFPERANYNRTMFSGERSQGIILEHELEDGVQVQVGGFNSLTHDDPEQEDLSPSKNSSLAGFASIRKTGKNYEVGVSGLVGDRPAYTEAGTESPTSPNIRREFIYVDGMVKGIVDPKLYARAEVMTGKDRIPKGTASATGRDAVDLAGFQVQLGYEINDRNDIHVRWEQFDRDLDTDGDTLNGYGVAYTYHVTKSTKLTAAHEIFEDQLRAAAGQSRYSVTTLRVQFKF